MGPLLALGLVLQIGAGDTNLDALGSEIERAVVAGDTATLERARTQLIAIVRRPDPRPLERYTLAYVDWRLRYLRGTKTTSETTALFAEAEAQLQKIIDADGSDAEALALLATIYGARIAEGGSAMRLGPRATRAITEAAQRAPDNPRVALLRGIHFFHTPTILGGGQERAEAELGRADALFVAHTSERWPHWGQVDALAWLGQLLAKKRDYVGARVTYERALALEPKHVWIRALVAKLEVGERSADRRKP